MANTPTGLDWESDPYKVLGVAPTASTDEVHRAYRRAAKVAHPDKGGSHAAMLAASAAWEVLRDADRRAAFDRSRGSTDLAVVTKWQSAARDARASAATYPRQWASFTRWVRAAIGDDVLNARYEWALPEQDPHNPLRIPPLLMPNESVGGVICALSGALAGVLLVLRSRWGNVAVELADSQRTLALVMQLLWIPAIGWCLGVAGHALWQTLLKRAGLTDDQKIAFDQALVKKFGYRDRRQLVWSAVVGAIVVVFVVMLMVRWVSSSSQRPGGGNGNDRDGDLARALANDSKFQEHLRKRAAGTQPGTSTRTSRTAPNEP